MHEMRIGELAEHSKVSTRALRYYEEQGILTSERTSSGQRRYDESAIERVHLIQQLYSAGLGSRTIATILPCVDAGHAEPEVLENLRSERDRITAGIADLEEARRRLDRVIELTEHPERCVAVRDLDPQTPRSPAPRAESPREKSSPGPILAARRHRAARPE